jgi:phenol hydroxylase P5 protein
MTYQLTIEPLGQTIDIEDGQTILDAALRAGIYLPHACCHGLCATCKVQVTDGEVEVGEASSFALMDFEREEGKCLACCATPNSDITIEADVDVDDDALNYPVRDFFGTIERIDDLTPTIKGITVHMDGDEPVHFQAGQYVNWHFAKFGTRAFSLANSPSTGAAVELHIRRIPGGQATGYIHDDLRVGDSVQLSGPYGRFFVKRSKGGGALFIAGGSGLSSPRSMVLDLLEQQDDRPITLLYGARNQEELYGAEEFIALAEKHANFRYAAVLSEEPDGSSWTGPRGFVHDYARELFNNDFRGMQAYLCGPPRMIDAAITTLMQGRLFERDIHVEKFISAADAQQVRSPLFKRV